MNQYRTTPLLSVHTPPGIPFIIGNEGAERFSFYGMRAILVVFMTQYLMSASGEPDLMREEQAKGWFYFSINFSAFLSILATPWLMEAYDPSVAFAVPGVLMLIATVVFGAGRHRFVHIPPGGKHFVKEALSSVGLKALGRLTIIYVFVAMFWALFDQTASAWVLQAQHMNREILGVEILPAQIQAANPLLVMLLTAVLFTLVVRYYKGQTYIHEEVPEAMHGRD